MSEIIKEVLNTLEKRQENYAPPEKNFPRIAKGWSVILGTEITPEQVALCMIWLKVCREVERHTFDNLLDLVGYTICLERIIEAGKNEQHIQTQNQVVSEVSKE